MAITAINTVRAGMILHGVDIDTLCERMSAAGHRVVPKDLRTMIGRRRMPALTFMHAMLALGGTMLRMPDDMAELT